MAVHTHQCPKCGQVWRHDPRPHWSAEMLERAHNCPGCGKYTTAGPKDISKQAEYDLLPLKQPEEHPKRE